LGRLCHVMLTGLHHMAAFTGEDGFWVGASAAILHRLGAIALLGEARHASGREGLSRETIYADGFRNPFLSRRKSRRAIWVFENWPWGESYGGEAWAACGRAWLELDKAIKAFVDQQTNETYVALGSALNSAVNQAHNGGWWLNKFVSESALNEAAGGNPRLVIDQIPELVSLSEVSERDKALHLAMWRCTKPIPDIEKLAAKTPIPIQKPTQLTHAPMFTSPVVEPFAHAKLVHPTSENGYLHVQYKLPGDAPDGYETLDCPLSDLSFNRSEPITAVKSCESSKSLAGSTTPYYKLSIEQLGSKFVITIPNTPWTVAVIKSNSHAKAA
jgi:hypothetical protein